MKLANAVGKIAPVVEFEMQGYNKLTIVKRKNAVCKVQ